MRCSIVPIKNIPTCVSRYDVLGIWCSTHFNVPSPTREYRRMLMEHCWNIIHLNTQPYWCCKWSLPDVWSTINLLSDCWRMWSLSDDWTTINLISDWWCKWSLFGVMISDIPYAVFVKQCVWISDCYVLCWRYQYWCVVDRGCASDR